MAPASHTPHLSLFSNAQGFSAHGGQYNAAGHDNVVHHHYYSYSGHADENSRENNQIATAPDRPNTSAPAISSVSGFRFPDITRIFRTRSLEIDVINIIEAECSSLLNRSSAPHASEIYTRLMLKHRHGYPLYNPEPERSLPIEYLQKGVRIGDVGRITPDGAFDFLFNVDASQASLINPTPLPTDFETVPPVRVRSTDYFQLGDYLLSDNVHQTQATPSTYQFSAPGASVLQTPKGATLFQAENTTNLYGLATRHAVNWYEYMATYRSIDIPNGSLYLVTGCIKARNWGTGVLYGRPSEHDYLEFISEDEASRRKYHWRKRGPIATRVGPTSTEAIAAGTEEPNQCVFIRGYKIALGDKLWKKVMRKAITISSGKGGPSNLALSSIAGHGQRDSSGDGTSISRNNTPAGSSSGYVSHSSTADDAGAYEEGDEDLDDPSISDGSHESSDGTILEPIVSAASPAHPSDIIISTLAQLEPEAEVILAHDSEWCNLLPEDFAVAPSNLNIRGLLENVARSSLAVTDHNGCVSLVKKPTTDSAEGVPCNVEEPSHTGGIISSETEDAESFENRRYFRDGAAERDVNINIRTSEMPTGSESDMRQRSITASMLHNLPTAVMKAASSGIPNEIIEEILVHLDFPSMMKCRAVCSSFRELVDSSPYFHWKRELGISGMGDGGKYPLATRRQMLARYQQGWDNLQWTKGQKKKFMHGLWEAKGNILAQSNPGKTEIYFDQMESQSRNVEARSWTVNTTASKMETFNIDPEQDLLIIIGSPFEQLDQYIIQIFLMKLSTGEPLSLPSGNHVLTHASTHVQWVQDKTGPTICGDNFCILFYDNMTGTEIKLWNWKTGEAVASIASNQVKSLIFLSERHIMFSIAQDQNLFVLDFVAGGPETHRLEDEIINKYTFGLPPVVESAEVFGLSVLTGAKPIWNHHPALSPPFFISRRDRLHAIQLTVDDAAGDERQVMIFVLGSTLLSIIADTTLPNATHFDWSMWGPDGARLIVDDYFTPYGLCGMKFISTQKLRGEPTKHIYVYDFNQMALKWNEKNGNGAAHTATGEDIESLAREGKPTVAHVAGPTKIAAGDIFRDDVETRLKYRIICAEVPDQFRAYHLMCGEDGIIIAYGQTEIEEFHILTI